MVFRFFSLFIGALSLFTHLGCTDNYENASMQYEDDEIVASKVAENNADLVNRKLIKDGLVEFETSDISYTRKLIFEAVDKYDAYISSDKEFSSPNRKSNTIVIRVPTASFNSLLKESTQGVDQFDNKQIDVKDVTEEFLDVEARLKTKKELEQRYIELLTKAINVTEILEIEKEIGLLRSEIESIEGRLRYLQDRVSLSTLTIMFYTYHSNNNRFGKQLKKGFENGWTNFIKFIVLLINIWPFIVIVLGFIIGLRFFIIKNKATKPIN